MKAGNVGQTKHILKITCIVFLQRHFVYLVGRIMISPPQKKVHVLIPRVCEFVTSHGRMGCADVIKVKDLVRGRLF